MSLDDIGHAAHVGHLQDRIRDLEAKLREAEQGHAIDMERYATQADERIRLEMQRAEKAERERDEARERLEQASRHIHDTTHERLVTWKNCRHWSCPGDRAALGEKR